MVPASSLYMREKVRLRLARPDSALNFVLPKKLSPMTPKADLHTHTIVSGHAYSTIQEMAHAAAERHIEILGITEHGPGVPGACHEIYFSNMHVIPRTMYGVKLMPRLRNQHSRHRRHARHH